jgi:integrase
MNTPSRTSKPSSVSKGKVYAYHRVSWTENGFRSSVFKFLGKLETEGKVEPGLTIHGLRHTCGTLLRELGFDRDTIADMLGQEDAGMAEWYARDADLQRKLGGVVKKLDRHFSVTNKNVP